MAQNVLFKKGLRANLPASYAAGTFYVTTDERAMYLDISDSERIRLGDFQEFATLDALKANVNPSTTAMYYVTELNVLAKWNGAEYVQINPDTGATSVEVVGSGNAVTEARYDAETRKLVLTKGENFVTKNDFDLLNTYVGVIPEGYTEESIVAYIDKKAAETLNAASGGSSASAASVLAALNTYKSENDSKVTANTNAIGAIKDGTVIDSFADVETELAKKVEAVEGKSLIDNSEITRLGGMSNGANKVEASATNGNIKIDGVETVVYTHPAKHAIADVDGLQDALNGKALDSDLDAVDNRVQNLEKLINFGSEPETIDEAPMAYYEGGVYVSNLYVGDFNSGVEVATKATTLAGYGIADAYTKGAVDAAVAEAKAAGDNAQDAVDAIVADYLKASDKAELNGLITAEQARAEGIEGGLRTDVDAIKGDYLKAADKTALQEQITANASAIELLTNGVSAEEVDGVNDLIQYVKDHGTEVTGMKADIAANSKAIEDQATSDAATYETKTDASSKLAEAKGYTDTAKAAVIGTADDASSADTIKGAKKYAEEKASAAESAAKTYADGLDTAMNTRVEALEAIDHDHTNKAELDRIASGDVAKWNATYAQAHVHANKDVLMSISEAKVAAWDAAEGNAKAHADGLNTAMDTRVTALEGIDHDAYVGADAALKTALEAQIASGDADTLAAAKTDAANKDAVVLAEAQGYASQAKADAIATAEADAESKVNALAGNVYAKTETYTQAEVDAAIAAAVTAATEWGSF